MRIEVVHFINPHTDKRSETHVLQETYTDYYKWVCKAYKHAWSELNTDPDHFCADWFGVLEVDNDE